MANIDHPQHSLLPRECYDLDPRTEKGDASAVAESRGAEYSDHSAFKSYWELALKFEYYLLAVTLAFLAYGMNQFGSYGSYFLYIPLSIAILVLVSSLALGVWTQYVAFDALKQLIGIKAPIKTISDSTRDGIEKYFKWHFGTLAVGAILLLLTKFLQGIVTVYKYSL